MFREYREDDKFSKILLQIYLEKFTHLFESITKSLSYVIAW